jgi:digeranylgeranylglycerophospholipid reductase
MEYVMTNVPESLKTTLAFYFGSEYAYRGYSWIFPMNGNRDAKVGTSALGPMPKDKSLEDLQKKFINALPYFEKMEPIEIHAGAARADGGVKNHVYKNIVLIGDSAHQINPLLGEGIRHALFAGRLAAGIIDQWLSEKDANDGDLKRRYEAAWKKKFGTAWRLSNLAIKYAAGFNDKQWDETIEAIGKLSPDDFFRLISDYDPKVLLKYPSLAAKMIKIKLS